MKDKAANQKILKRLNELKYGEIQNKQDEFLDIFDQDPTPIQDEETLSDQRKDNALKLKFQICKFIIDHQLPFSISQDLLELIKKSANEFYSGINACNLDRNKASEIIRECICPVLRTEILNQLNSSPFSISVDESTDIHGTSYLAVSATYLPHIENDGRVSFKEPVSSLVSVIELDESHDGETLYQKLLEEFFSLTPLLEENCIGIACDQGSNLNGKGKGLSGRLCSDYPYMIKVNDWCIT